MLPNHGVPAKSSAARSSPEKIDDLLNRLVEEKDTEQEITESIRQMDELWEETAAPLADVSDQYFGGDALNELAVGDLTHTNDDGNELKGFAQTSDSFNLSDKIDEDGGFNSSRVNSLLSKNNETKSELSPVDNRKTSPSLSVASEVGFGQNSYQKAFLESKRLEQKSPEFRAHVDSDPELERKMMEVRFWSDTSASSTSSSKGKRADSQSVMNSESNFILSSTLEVHPQTRETISKEKNVKVLKECSCRRKEVVN